MPATRKELILAGAVLLAIPLLVEAALVHGVGFAHQDVGGDLVFGATELSQRGKQNEIIESLLR